MKYPPTPSTLTLADFVTLSCLRNEVADLKDHLKIAIEGVRRWDHLIQVWEGQGILPLIAYRLNEHDLLDCAPPQAAAKIRHIDAEYSRISHVYAEETVGCAQALLDSSIRCCVLKDPRGYAALHLRPGYDLDLLVHPSDVEAARECLAAIGMQAETSPYRSALVDKVLGMHRVRDGLKIAVDLHWNILGGYMPRAALIDADWLLSRSTTMQMVDTDVPVLRIEDHILNTSIHSLTHECRWPSRLITYLDTSEAIRSWTEEIDWTELVQTAARWDALPDAQLGLVIASRVLRAPVPTEVLNTIRPDFGALGLEASAFGYLNYVWKSVDKVIEAYGVRNAASIMAYSETLLPAAREAAGMIRDAAMRLSKISGGGPVTTFGEAGALIPDSTIPAFGRIEAISAPVSWEQLCANYTELGFTDQNGVLVKQLPHTTVRITLAPANERFSHLNPVVSSPMYIRRAWARRGAIKTPALEMRIIAGTSAERLNFVLSRYSTLRAIDPPGIVATADLISQLTTNELVQVYEDASGIGRITLDLVLACGSQQGLGEWKWSFDDAPVLLDSLDRRTASLEELTKFLATPAGASLALLLCRPQTNRLLSIIRMTWSALRVPSRLILQWRTIRRILTTKETSRRVPIRIYVRSSGDALIGIDEDAEETLQLDDVTGL
jgi:hypothetical protein